MILCDDKEDVVKQSKDKHKTISMMAEEQKKFLLTEPSICPFWNVSAVTERNTGGSGSKVVNDHQSLA